MAKKKAGKAAPAAEPARKPRPERERLERLEEAVRVLASAANQTAHVEQVLEGDRLEAEEDQAEE